MYLPILGLLLLVVSFLNKLKAKAAVSLAVVILLIWGSISVNYMPVWKNSEKLYNQALKIDENNVEPRLNRASYYLANKQDEKGLADLQILINRYPRLEKPYYNRAIYYFLKKEYEKALPDLDKVLSIDTLHFEGLVNRGIAHLRLKQLYEAHSDFSKAYDIDSNHFALNKNIASMYNQAENHNTALLFAQKALETNPDDTDLLRIKGVALYFGLQFNEAIETFDRVIALKDEYDEVWYFKSKSLFETGLFEEAQQSLDKAIEKGYPAEETYLKKLEERL
jgi:tetratricopeptide (TPR) repeat protein